MIRLRPVIVVLVSSALFVACSTDAGQVDSADTTDASTAGPTAPTTDAPSSTTASTTTSTTTTTTPTTTSAAPTLAECLGHIDLRLRLGQLLFPVVTQAELPTATELASEGLIAGVVLVGTPDETLSAALTALQEASLIGPSIVAVDEEGGRVQRVAGMVGALPSARAAAATLTPEEAGLLHREHAEKLATLGFTMNLAPVLDLDTGAYIRDRSFSSDPAVVTDYGLAVADGIRAAGITPVVKHFPGHGRGTDSHTGLPTLPELAELRSSDLLPFEAAIARGDLPIMIGHLRIPGLTGEEPATMSPELVGGVLRDELGFDGLVMTDALGMDAIAIRRDDSEAALAALSAGVDLAMIGRIGSVEATLARLEAAVDEGELSEADINRSFVRVMETRGIEPCAIPADVEAAIRCQSVTTGGCALATG